jgi:hypothetical protein
MATLRVVGLWLILTLACAGFWEATGKWTTVPVFWVTILPSAAMGWAFSRWTLGRRSTVLAVVGITSIVHPIFGEFRRIAYDSEAVITLKQPGAPPEAAAGLTRLFFQRKILSFEMILALVISLTGGWWAAGLLTTMDRPNAPSIRAIDHPANVVQISAGNGTSLEKEKT